MFSVSRSCLMCSITLRKNLSLKNLIRLDVLKSRTVCTTPPIPEEKEKKEIKTSKRSHSKELDAYLSSYKHLLKIKNKIPERYLKKNVLTPDDLYLVDCKIADIIVEAILPDLKKSNAVIIESNPGFGFVTEKLLEAKIGPINAYEATVLFREHLFVCFVIK